MPIYSGSRPPSGTTPDLKFVSGQEPCGNVSSTYTQCAQWQNLVPLIGARFIFIVEQYFLVVNKYYFVYAKVLNIGIFLQPQLKGPWRDDNHFRVIVAIQLGNQWLKPLKVMCY